MAATAAIFEIYTERLLLNPTDSKIGRKYKGDLQIKTKKLKSFQLEIQNGLHGRHLENQGDL